VLETLPMPVHYTGGMEPISYGGTFTLERILGTVPVEEDGSAYFELPRHAQPLLRGARRKGPRGETHAELHQRAAGRNPSCVGCHEHRSQTPRADLPRHPGRRQAPARIEPIAGVPDVIDFPRDVQPVLDRPLRRLPRLRKDRRGGPRAGRLILTGDRGPQV
jgi:hypothetical protein